MHPLSPILVDPPPAATSETVVWVAAPPGRSSRGNSQYW